VEIIRLKNVPRARRRRGVTITEVLVVLLVVAVVLAALLPTARRLRSESGQITSAANLQVLALSNAMYAADWNDRQVTWCPDDMGLVGGNLEIYSFDFGCPVPLLLGFGSNGNMWAPFLGCHGPPAGTWQAASSYIPQAFGPFPGTGSFRWTGSKAFAAHVDGRFYSPTLYAPNDLVPYEVVTPYFDYPAEFTLPPAPNNFLWPSSYAFSPAAMWHPKVLSRNPADGLWWRNPTSFAISHRSPTVSQCAHPELKTRMIEHNWNLGQPGPINPAFAGGQTPYFFSHGIDAAPLTLFFDGRVGELPNTKVAADDATVLASTRGEVGLWSRDTPSGANGYYGTVSFDGFVTGHHVYTIDGILGRDILSVDASRPDGLAGDDRGAVRRQRLQRHRHDVYSGPLLEPPMAGVSPQQMRP